MKRSTAEYLGHPMSRDFRQDVAGRPQVARPEDVASFRHALGGPTSTAETHADSMAAFVEFMEGETVFPRDELSEPDPMFREALRRRLWRAHVIANLRDGGETH